MKIGVVVPTFTAAAYNDAFYPWFVKYEKFRNTHQAISSDVNMFTGHMVPQSSWAFTGAIPGALNLSAHLKSSRPNDDVIMVSDEDIHNGMTNYDVLIVFHNEYMTQQEYDNFKSFVANGGTLVSMDGNVFYAEVSYNPTNRTVTFIRGHGWVFDGRVAKGDLGERWWPDTANWFGSNSDAGTTTMTWAYLRTHFGNNPFNYPAGTSGAENQYLTSLDDQIILDYKATGGPGRVATYWKRYGKGKVLCFSFFTDKVMSNPAFITFFDKTFAMYALGKPSVMPPPMMQPPPMMRPPPMHRPPHPMPTPMPVIPPIHVPPTTMMPPTMRPPTMMMPPSGTLIPPMMAPPSGTMMPAMTVMPLDMKPSLDLTKLSLPGNTISYIALGVGVLILVVILRR